MITMESTKTRPQGDLVLRTLALPADTNANGDIFGGWLMSQMDIELFWRVNATMFDRYGAADDFLDSQEIKHVY